MTEFYVAVSGAPPQPLRMRGMCIVGRDPADLVSVIESHGWRPVWMHDLRAAPLHCPFGSLSFPASVPALAVHSQQIAPGPGDQYSFVRPELTLPQGMQGYLRLGDSPRPQLPATYVLQATDAPESPQPGLGTLVLRSLRNALPAPVYAPELPPPPAQDFRARKVHKRR